MKKFTLTALSALLVSGGAMASDAWNGNINFTGAITNNSCKITNVNGNDRVDSTDISVNFGNVNADQISGAVNGTNTPYFPASSLGGSANTSNTITLTCDASKNGGLSVKLAAKAADLNSNQTIFKPNGNTSVGVAIYANKDSTTALNLTKAELPLQLSLSDLPGASGTGTLAIAGASFSFAAGLVKTAAIVTAGSFSGSIPFRVVYQ